jgi:hypothetical protein
MFDDAGGRGKPRIGQIALIYDTDEQSAAKRGMDQFRFFTGGWRVNTSCHCRRRSTKPRGRCARRTSPS